MTQTQQLSQNLTGTKIDNGALELVSVIGIGAYGVVYKALARDGKYYAVKCLNKTGLDSRQKGFQRREIALHTLASSHPNIVSLHNVIETSTCIYVVLSYCSDGDLFSQITEKSRYLGNDALIKDVFLQIVDAVDYCHKLGIYHRDLKPENILCDALGARVVLADFGLATAEKTSGDFGCGSTFYMSPECQGGLFQRLGSYSTLHNDVWSLGVILVNLTCGRNPWKQACPSDETFRAYLSNPDFLQSILPVSKQCNELLKRIFALNPAQRISIKELKYEVSRITRWTMTLDELRYATRATKEAARAWAPAYILDDPCDAPPAKPLQPTTPHHHQQQPQQAHHSRIPQPQQTYPAPAQQHPVPARHQATAAPAQPKPRQARETVFDITDSSTVSSVDSLAEWKAHQAHLQQQQARRQQHAGARLQSPYIPSPATSPSVSSAACPEFTTPTLPSPAAFAKSRIQQQQSHVRGPAQQTLRSDFSLSDSDESSMDEDDMEYAGGRSPLYHSTNARLQHHSPQQQYHTRQSPNPNVSFGSRPTHYDYATRSKNSPPPPLTPQAPRTPRQAFTTAASAAERRRKQSIESDSSSSSISSDASWTGLPPTPDTPVFAKRHTAAVIAAKGNGSPSPMTHLQPPEKQSMLSSLTSPIAIAGAKLKMAF